MAILSEQFNQIPNFLGQCLDQLDDVLLWIGNDGRLLHANGTALECFGYDYAELTRLTIHDLDTDFSADIWGQHWDALKRRGVLTVTVQIRTKEESCLPVEMVYTYMKIDGMEFSIAVMRDISYRAKHDERAQLMQYSVDQMVDSAFWIGQDASIVYANDAACRNLGYDHAELLELKVFDIDPNITESGWGHQWDRIKQRRRHQFESEHITRDGRHVPVDIRASFLQIGSHEYHVAFVHDITQRKLQEAQLNHLATHDALTGLPNRGLLNDRLDVALLNAKRYDNQLAVMLIDLDQFKLVNDNFGHQAGDILLKAVSMRMRSVLRGSDTVARQGGDEFVVLLDHIQDPHDCATIVQKLMQAITEPVDVGGHLVEPGASIGIALYPQDGDDVDGLVKNADIAMYEAKDLGRGNYQFYQKAMGDDVSKHLSVVTGLQEALNCDNFRLHYQPIFDLTNEQLMGAEALLRWQHESDRLVPPAEFIPVAEESGLIVPMGAWVVQEVCRQLSQWREQGLELHPIAVNLSARQLRDKGILTLVRDALRQYQVPPELLSLELTESMVMDDPEQVIEILNEFKGMGVTVAIDDFGTGYSSLSYLQRFPVDIIKIDRSLIKDINSENDEAVIANAIISLSHTMGYKVLAEGIETEIQGELLRSKGCDLVQGFFFGRPIPAEAFRALLVAHGAG